MKRELKKTKEKLTDHTIGQFPLPMEKISDVLLLPYNNDKVGIVRKPHYLARILDYNTGVSWARH